jgi:hypothetical protein
LNTANFIKSIQGLQIKFKMTKPVHQGSETKRMLKGGGIALILISIFLFKVEDPKPEWGKL